MGWYIICLNIAHYSYPLNDEREVLLDKPEAKTEASTRAEAIDAAIKHYLESIENLQDAADQLTPEQARAISTSEVSLTYYPQVR